MECGEKQKIMNHGDKNWRSGLNEKALYSDLKRIFNAWLEHEQWNHLKQTYKYNRTRAGWDFETWATWYFGKTPRAPTYCWNTLKSRNCFWNSSWYFRNILKYFRSNSWSIFWNSPECFGNGLFCFEMALDMLEIALRNYIMNNPVLSQTKRLGDVPWCHTMSDYAKHPWLWVCL